MGLGDGWCRCSSPRRFSESIESLLMCLKFDFFIYLTIWQALKKLLQSSTIHSRLHKCFVILLSLHGRNLEYSEEFPLLRVWGEKFIYYMGKIYSHLNAATVGMIRQTENSFHQNSSLSDPKFEYTC